MNRIVHDLNMEFHSMETIFANHRPKELWVHIGLVFSSNIVWMRIDFWMGQAVRQSLCFLLSVSNATTISNKFRMAANLSFARRSLLVSLSSNRMKRKIFLNRFRLKVALKIGRPRRWEDQWMHLCDHSWFGTITQNYFIPINKVRQNYFQLNFSEIIFFCQKLLFQEQLRLLKKAFFASSLRLNCTRYQTVQEFSCRFATDSISPYWPKNLLISSICNNKFELSKLVS